MNKNRIIGISIIALIMGILLIIANLYIDYNLRKYSVYYARNMEHKEGTQPELAMVLDNLDLMRKPKKSNIDYRYDGRCIIYNFKYRWITMYQDYLALTGPMILYIALLTINIHHTILIDPLK